MNINTQFFDYTFKLSSKARTLQELKKSFWGTNIADLVFFTYQEWVNDKNNCLKTIDQNLKSNLFIVRSSSLNEDTIYSSKAGSNLSIQNVLKKELKVSIDKVFESYRKLNYDDEVLIQPMLRNVFTSGVAFSHDTQTSSPYKSVNWNYGNDTSAITSGKCNGRIWYHIGKYSYIKDEILKSIIQLIDKLYVFFGKIPIDCEFAVTKEKQKTKIWILQVRPLILKNQSIPSKILDQKLDLLQNQIKKLSESKNKLLGESTIFGVMPDWNPAEIIGIRPRPLALSLYQNLITDKIWAVGRSNYGYKDVRDYKLLHSFFGQPYIDTRISFNSLLPKTINKNLGHKLVNFYLNKLVKKPSLHDKIEFGIVISSFSFDLHDRLIELKKSGFSDSEICDFKKSLIYLTNQVIKNDNIIPKDIKLLKILEKKLQNTYLPKSVKIKQIKNAIEDLKRYGTLPFVGLARVGFIAVQMLRSMVQVKIINEKEYNKFMSSCSTISKKLTEDKENLNKEEFLKKYGHLRPGTYDILSPRYDEKPDDYFIWNSDVNSSKPTSHEFKLEKKRNDEITEFLKINNINITSTELFKFIKKGIELREYSKFIFTKQLSKILQLIEVFGQSYGINKQEISYVPISFLLQLPPSSKSSKFVLEKKIKNEKYKYNFTQKIKLPPLITKLENVFSFEWPNLLPNFITQKSVIGEVTNVSDKTKISGKIIFIPNADPGYDWIFSHKPAGLITAWGGVNSHMAIRASELQIPAALGVGEILYKNWQIAKTLNLDCLAQKIEIIK